MNEKHERKENKKRRKGLLLLLLALLLVGGVGTWLLFGEALTGGRTPHEPARPAAPVTQLAEPGETTEPAEPTSPEEPTEPGQNTEATEPTDPTEPGTDEPTDPTEPTEATEPNDPVTPVEPTLTPEPVHTHSYTDTRTEPSCTADGKIISKCGCGDTKTTVLPKLGHDYKQVSRTEATTSSEGKIVKKCSRCGDTKTETIPKLTPSEPTPEPVHTHSYTDTRTEPTCTADGKIVSKCSCGDTRTTVIPALGHDHSEPVYETRTYENVRYEEHRMCAACGMDLTAAGIHGTEIALHSRDHALNGESTQTYSEWVEIKETVTENVLIGHRCIRCGDIQYLPL